MSISRRDFLKSAAAGALVVALSPAYSLAQTAQQQVDPANVFDIRNVQREMGLPSTGPFIDIFVNMKKNPQKDTHFTTYKITIDANYMHSAAMSEADIAKAPQLANVTQRPIMIRRPTPAFAEQLNPEIYLPPSEIRRQIPALSLMDDDTLMKYRQSRRENLKLALPDSKLVIGTVLHLIHSHGFEQGPDLTAADGTKISTSLAMENARNASRAALDKQTASAQPTSRPSPER